MASNVSLKCLFVCVWMAYRQAPVCCVVLKMIRDIVQWLGGRVGLEAIDHAGFDFFVCIAKVAVLKF